MGYESSRTIACIFYPKLYSESFAFDSFFDRRVPKVLIDVEMISTTAMSTLTLTPAYKHAQVRILRRYLATSSGINPKKAHLVPSSGTYPSGFRLTGKHCGVKKDSSALDLALVVSDKPETVAAGVFTTNAFKAAPVQISQRVLADSNGVGVRGIVINSGCANAVTGLEGMENAWKMSRTLGALIKQPDASASVDTPNALVMSTGVIGQHLPIGNITSNISPAFDKLGSAHDDWMLAARAIMTTDTFPKLRSKEVDIPKLGKIRLAGIDKGAGMIHPNMATLLGLICTDAKIDAQSLQAALRYAADHSFNAISIDGDMSTNDTLVALANGTEGPTIAIQENQETYIAFRDALTEFAIDLAHLVVRDGEGATKFITVTVQGSPSFEIAKDVASTISTSALVKTALYGQDANWGRILCSVGYSAAGRHGVVDPSKVSVSMRPGKGNSLTSDVLPLLANGEPVPLDEVHASKILAQEDVEIVVDLGLGPERAVMWTCDFSHEYVTINGSYRT